MSLGTVCRLSLVRTSDMGIQGMKIPIASAATRNCTLPVSSALLLRLSSAQDVLYARIYYLQSFIYS